MIDAIIDRGLLPDSIVRAGIRRIVAGRLREQEAGGVGAQSRRFDLLLHTLEDGPVAVATDAANRQHYEVPARFFELVLGPRLKYSDCLRSPVMVIEPAFMSQRPFQLPAVIMSKLTSINSASTPSRLATSLPTSTSKPSNEPSGFLKLCGL